LGDERDRLLVAAVNQRRAGHAFGRKYGVRSLIRLADPQVPDLLVRLVKDRDSSVSFAAVTAAIEHGDARSLPAIQHISATAKTALDRAPHPSHQGTVRRCGGINRRYTRPRTAADHVPNKHLTYGVGSTRELRPRMTVGRRTIMNIDGQLTDQADIGVLARPLAQGNYKPTYHGAGPAPPSSMKSLTRTNSIALAGLLLAVVLAGCGSPADPSTDSPPAPGAQQPGAQQPDAQQAGPQQTGAEQSKAKQPPTKLVGWAPNFGPISKTAPPSHRWYQQVQDRDCTALLTLIDSPGQGATEQDVNLYGGLAKACKGRWDEAIADLSKLKRDELVDDQGKADCLMQTTFDTLTRLVEAHRSEPGVVVRISGSAAPTCQPPPAEPDETDAP
jgi:hypothetical protein